VLGVFAMYRMTRRTAPAREEQGPFVAMPKDATPTAANLAQHAPTTAGSD
jgi:hypothetical protein